MAAYTRGACALFLFLGLAACVVGYTSDELSAMPKGGATCALLDPFACWGNGRCAGGRCVCVVGWTGSNCTVLDLAPAPANGAIRRKGWSTWGGSPIMDTQGKVHLFASQMADHCNLGTWQNNSMVIHAVADSVVGPYTVTNDVVLPPFHHNPSVQRAPDGTYVLYCIGSAVARCTGEPLGSSGTGSPRSHSS